MKLTASLCSILLGSVLWTQYSEPEPISFKIAGQEWSFPATAGDAVTAHLMDYKPPGYYYKEYPNGIDVILAYHYEDGDFDNELQPKQVLFPRKLHSYIFRFPNTPEIYDSLRRNLESTYNKKFEFTKGMKDSTMLKNPLLSASFKKEFEWDFLTVNNDLTIGIAKGRKKVVIRYMYDLSPGLMGIYMGGYIE